MNLKEISFVLTIQTKTTEGKVRAQRITVFQFLQIVTFGLFVSAKQAHHTQNEIEQKKKTRLKPRNLKKPETITITKNANKSLNSI